MTLQNFTEPTFFRLLRELNFEDLYVLRKPLDESLASLIRRDAYRNNEISNAAIFAFQKYPRYNARLASVLSHRPRLTTFYKTNEAT